MRIVWGLGLWAGLALCAPPVVVAGEEISGVWEIASLGADRRVEIWRAADAFTAYRVLKPEFEGKPYTLEHLFVGKIRGQKISGDLWVREEGMPEFEKLRAFVGQIESARRLMLDGLPLDLQDEALTGQPPELAKKKKAKARRPVPRR